MEVLCTQGDSRDEAKHQRSLLRNNIRDGYNSDFCGPLMLVEPAITTIGRQAFLKHIPRFNAIDDWPCHLPIYRSTHNHSSYTWKPMTESNL